MGIGRIWHGDGMKRVETGIKGLDDMLQGGIPEGRHVALCGGPGSGKTLFSMQYLYHGAKLDEPGLYVSLEETPEKLIKNVQAAFSDLDVISQVGQGLYVEKPSSFDLNTISSLIENYAKTQNIKRLVIDSSTILRAKFKEAYDYRETMYEFLDFLGMLNVTVITTVELPSPERRNHYGLEHFLMDGIINLYHLDKGSERVRALEIIKMRATSHSQFLVPFRITPKGIVVYKDERVL